MLMNKTDQTDLIEAIQDIADQLRATSDETPADFYGANVADGLYAIAKAIDNLAAAVRSHSS
jgi:hypothetical protein